MPSSLSFAFTFVLSWFKWEKHSIRKMETMLSFYFLLEKHYSLLYTTLGHVQVLPLSHFREKSVPKLFQFFAAVTWLVVDDDVDEDRVKSLFPFARNIVFEGNLHISPTVSETDESLENPGMLDVSMKKSSNVARDCSCFPSDAIVF